MAFFFNGTSVVIFTGVFFMSHELGWHIEVPYFWNNNTRSSFSWQIWYGFMLVPFRALEPPPKTFLLACFMWTYCDSCASGRVVHWLKHSPKHPLSCPTIDITFIDKRGVVFVLKLSPISRDMLETHRYALPEILMRRLRAVASDAKWYFVFMDKTQGKHGEHDISVLLDDLER